VYKINRPKADKINCNWRRVGEEDIC